MPKSLARGISALFRAADKFSKQQSLQTREGTSKRKGAFMIGPALARELIEMFLKAGFCGAIRRERMAAKVKALETPQVGNCTCLLSKAGAPSLK